MDSLSLLSRARAMLDAGRFQDVIRFLSADTDEVCRSPSLCLLLGMAHARTGGYSVGGHYVESALTGSRQTGDRHIEGRALNVLGAIAFETGAVERAIASFQRAGEVARAIGDGSAIGRCETNLGIVNNVRGQHATAIGAFTRALAAFDRTADARGRVEARNNLGIAYRDRGDPVRALDEANLALAEAPAIGDAALTGQVRACRAEHYVAIGEVGMARVDIEAAVETHCHMNDPVRESEDLRVLAVVEMAEGRLAEAAGRLRGVIRTAEAARRPLLAGAAGRDLALLLERTGSKGQAREVARVARSRLERLGAAHECARLDAVFGMEPRGGVPA